MIRCFFTLGTLCAVIFTPTASYADSNRPLEQPKTTNVDWISFGIASLETHLRLEGLETCMVADCSRFEADISVVYAEDHPLGWPDESLAWPSGGAILIRKDITRSGPDSSYATEDGCKSSLELLRLISVVPWVSYARFFLPRDAWIGLYPKTRDVDTINQLADIESHVFVVVTEKHEWQHLSGTIDRSVWVTCVGPAARSGQGDEGDIVVVGRGQVPN